MCSPDVALAFCIVSSPSCENEYRIALTKAVRDTYTSALRQLFYAAQHELQEAKKRPPCYKHSSRTVSSTTPSRVLKTPASVLRCAVSGLIALDQSGGLSCHGFNELCLCTGNFHAICCTDQCRGRAQCLNRAFNHATRGQQHPRDAA